MSLTLALLLALQQHQHHHPPKAKPATSASQPAKKPAAKTAPKAAPKPAPKASTHGHAGHAKPAAKPAPKAAPKPAPNPVARPAATTQQVDHSAHAMPQDDPHAGHDMAMPQVDDPHAGHDMGDEDPHAGHDMGKDDPHAGHDMMVIPKAPPPPEAGSGPARAAEALWGKEAMDRAREKLRIENGGQKVFWFQADRAELRVADEGENYLWDVQGYYGGDLDKFWFKSEGEGEWGGSLEGADVQGLWSHAIAPYWDLQTGIRQDLTGPARTYATVGIQGLAPYLFEVDAGLFLSNKGDLTADVEVELDQRITPRLILQPRAELSLAAQDVPELGVGAGLSFVEAGVRLRYEFAREFAPYIGLEQEWLVGGTADFARAEGHAARRTNIVAGIRFWF
ncbi:copper resistance protein B [Sphingomicrobium lutaoense]|uniref:Copper resistance protein B n=1 Tax=Sphingomicrobium lutaoense TaxID=515949 RepID=A0A839Z2T2_9SPHN|nr:copper resistance protein B [Sphingomicrobium lutaoense]MBB3764930.1 copper resistance protein B [Sphingomicrobium lutaoense]